MTRFTALVLACLLAVPAQAETCPIPTLYPEYSANGGCLSLQCMGLRLLRDAYRRGEISTVRLARKSECDNLNAPDPMNGDTTRVPCTWDHNDYYVK